MFSEINGQRPMPYGAFEPNTSQAERLLMQENLLLRQSCQQLMYQMDHLVREKDHIYTQFHTFHLLYLQLKHDRNRIARQLTSAQRELEHVKRSQLNQNFHALGHHHLESFRRRAPRYYRSLKTTESSSSTSQRNQGNRRSSRRNFRRTQSAKYISEEHLAVQRESSYQRFDDPLHDYQPPESSLPTTPQQENHGQWPVDPAVYDNMGPATSSDPQNGPNSSEPELMDQNLYLHANGIVPFDSPSDDSDSQPKGGSTKLAYSNSLKQCVEFSKSLLDLSGRHIVGAERDECADEQFNSDNVEATDENQGDCVDQAPNAVNLVDQSMNTSPIPNETEQEPAKIQMESVGQQTDDLIEEARPLQETNLDIEFTDDANLVVNLSYISDCTTYLREVKLQNKPREFLGIFFESAFTSGVVVQQVVPNSIADRGGIRAGDRVLEICGINMRKANWKLANKIIQECEMDKVTFKVVSSEEAYRIAGPSRRLLGQTMSSSSSSGSNDEDRFIERARPLRKTCTLTRREAFLNKAKLHSYFERKHCKEAMLYQNCHLTVSLPRRITITQPLAKIKLLGGNAVGIFVHSIGDDFLANLLQIGDQLLEYNNFDLTKATAEDAAIELAKPARQNGVLVALFNSETYTQIQEKSIGDSFYIRTEFSRASINKSLEFKKGDILYVDNTLYNGKPGYWRAWQVDDFGQKTACGIIPSKYNAHCEMLKELQAQNHSRWNRFRFLTLPYRIFFWRSKLGYNRLNSEKRTEEKTRVLASCSVEYSDLPDIQEDSESQVDSTDISHAQGQNLYKLVNMVPLKKPRPVLIFGPFSQVIAEQLEIEFPHLFRQCSRETISVSGNRQRPSHEQYLHCAHQKDAYECIPIDAINEIIDSNVHPVISVVANTMQDFRSHNYFPIVVGVKFRSPKHIKETVNKWKISGNTSNSAYGLRPRSVCYKVAKNAYSHMQKLEHEFKDAIDVRVTGNNITFMCTQIKDQVHKEQNKVVWSETPALPQLL